MSHSEGSSSVPRKRSRKPRSAVWDVFEKLPIEDDGTQMVKCINCEQVFVGGGQIGTSTMKRHITKCPATDTENQLEGQLPPLNQEKYREKLSLSIVQHNYPFKFDKYWDCYSMVLSLAIVLDPRYKLKIVEFCFSKLDSATSQEKVASVRQNLYNLFEEYMQLVPASSTHDSSSVGRSSVGQDDVRDEMDDFDLFKSQHHGSNRNKSQLDIYLDEPLLDRKVNASLDVLSFWKVHRVRYPELSLMARDVLSIPITTVASESAFSTGGRIIGKYRSSIIPKNVEALLCTRDWLCDYGDSSDEEDDELAEDFEKLVSEVGTTNLMG